MRSCSAGLGFRNRQSPFLSGHCLAAVLQGVKGRTEELILKDPIFYFLAIVITLHRFQFINLLLCSRRYEEKIQCLCENFQTMELMLLFHLRSRIHLFLSLNLIYMQVLLKIPHLPYSFKNTRENRLLRMKQHKVYTRKQAFQFQAFLNTLYDLV